MSLLIFCNRISFVKRLSIKGSRTSIKRTNSSELSIYIDELISADLMNLLVVFRILNCELWFTIMIIMISS